MKYLVNKVSSASSKPITNTYSISFSLMAKRIPILNNQYIGLLACSYVKYS